jgi:hypothetical protein
MVQEYVSSLHSISLIPNPPRPGLYAVLGPQDLIPWALQEMTLRFSPKPIVWIDAANKFNAHWIAMNARTQYKDTREVLRSYHVARPFTAYQLEAMVTQKLTAAAARYRALFSVIADPLSLYEGAEGRDTQVHQSFRRFIDGLRAAATLSPIVLLIPEPGPQRYFSTVIKAATSWKRISAERGMRDAGEGVLNEENLLPNSASRTPR